MKWLATLLLAANVAFYLWAGGRSAQIEATAVPFAAADVNREGMLLLHEINSSAAAAAENNNNDEARPGRVLCYRIGPFKRETAWLASREWMRAQKFTHAAPRRVIRRKRVQRIYLGPFKTRNAAAGVSRRLTQKSIEHFIYQHKKNGVAVKGDLRISLGYFNQPKLAAKFLANSNAKGIDAKMSEEFPTVGPHDWIETSIDPARREALLSRDWGDAGVGVTTIDCAEARGG